MSENCNLVLDFFSMKYLPFITGVYSTAPGLIPLSKAIGKDSLLFHIDDTYGHYIKNKHECRSEGIGKYYLEHEVSAPTARTVNQFIIAQLTSEYPSIFSLENQYTLFNTSTGERIRWKPDHVNIEESQYLSLFDALCCQVQEDIAVVQMREGEHRDFLTAIHLCSPNHWSPAEKIGKPFHRIHEPVPNMERVTQHYGKMLSSIVTTKGPYTRFAWGIATDNRLNHHPEPPPGINPNTWHGRQHETDEQPYYIRTERQNLVGFPEVNAFMFTIRTYFYSVGTLDQVEKKALVSALESMSPEALHYKGLTNTIELLKKRLLRTES
jgi:dimethylamine monooxygenase subunit A